MSGIRPVQKLPESKKDIQWQKANADYWSNICIFEDVYMNMLYKAANGELDMLEYEMYTNPYGAATNNRAGLQGFPAKLKNYPIIPQILNLLLGEKRQRPIIANVTVNNEDVVTMKRIEEEKLLKTYGEQLFMNELNKLGIDTGVESEELDSINNVKAHFDKSWEDIRAKTGQEVLDYIIADKKIESKFVEGFLDWLVLGIVNSYKASLHDDIHYEIVSPKYTGYVADKTVKYIEDGQAACIRFRMTPSEFLDRFYDIIKEDVEEKDGSTTMDILSWLDTLGYNGSTSGDSVLMLAQSDVDRGRFTDSLSGNNFVNSTFTNTANHRALFNYTVEVIYINWKGWIHLKQLSVTNMYGESETIEVPYEYKESKEDGEILIQDFWVNQVYEMYRVDNKFYLGFKALENQRGSLGNPSKCKMSINGTIKRVGDLKALSLVELLMPFQHLYNFGHYKLNLILAKNKEKLLMLPLGLIPQKEGWDMFTSMYYADSTGILWVDESVDNFQITMTAIKSIDMGLGNYIQFMYTYIQNIKAEAEEVVGINRQRKGEIAASDGLGVTQDAQYTSSLLTEDRFAEFDEFQETELNGLLDHSKQAYRNGKKGQYIRSDQSTALLNIDAENNLFMGSEFGVRVSSSKKYEEKKKKLEHFAESLAQNGAKGSTLAMILNAEGNFNKLIDQLKDIEAQEQQMAQQQAQAEQEHEAAVQKMQLDDKQADRDLTKYKIDQDNETKIAIQHIANLETGVVDTNNDGEINELDILGHQLKQVEVLGKQEIEKSKIASKERTDNAKIKVERDNMKNDLQIARINAKSKAKAATKK